MKKLLANWGNYPVLEAEQCDAASVKAIRDFLDQEATVLARGNARSYGDAALNQSVVSMLDLDNFLDFDPHKGEIACQSGVLLSDILDFIVPKGFFLPVTPGTKFITVGGAIASDVHGKNHHLEGCFTQHVLHFDLLTAEGGKIVRCSPEENADLFWYTAGGMGLTGIILAARFKLKRIESAYILQESIKAKNIGEVMQLFEESQNWIYTMAWIDCLQRGKHLGRSVLMRGVHAKPYELSGAQQRNPLRLKPKRKLRIPFFFPSFVLNFRTVSIFNLFYYHKQLRHAKRGVVDYDSFFYPLDALYNWNRIYGRKGFTQYQFVLPKNRSEEGLHEILELIARSGQGSFLAVLKLFGKANPLAINSFPKEGYTLALDFKINDKLMDLIPRLDALMDEYEGRVYLAKDAFSERIRPVEGQEQKFDSLQNQRAKSL